METLAQNEEIKTYFTAYKIEPVKSDSTQVTQDSEKFKAVIDGISSQFTMHDYQAIYKVPMLYDAMMFGMLQCHTPTTLASRFKKILETKDESINQLRIFEIGAGSGAFAEALLDEIPDIGPILALDLYEEAKEAATRDRPRIYSDYVVADLCNLSAQQRKYIEGFAPNCVGVAAATGWGNHIPVEGFESAFDLLSPGGWFIFHVKPDDPDPECVALNEWISRKIENGDIVDAESDRIFHRYNIYGSEIYYDYVIGRKAF